MPDINMQVFEETKRNQLVTEIDVQTQVALDDYQVQFSDIANPTQSQDNVIIDRFGEFLPHWNESLDFDTWVKISMEVAGKRLLMLRGGLNASSKSNGIDTFILFLDFENTLDGFNGGISSTDQFKFGSYSLNLNSGTRERTAPNPDKPFVTMQWIRPATTTSQEIYQMRNISGTNGVYLGTSRAISGYWDYYDGGWLSAGVVQSVQWNKIETIHYDATYDIWINGVEAITGASYTTASITSGFRYNGTTVYIDGISRRKYTANKPTWTANGAEQNIAVALKSLGRVG